MGTLYIGNEKVCPAIYTGGSSGYSEIPSYQIVNGVANRRTIQLTGNEFDDITEISTNGMAYAFYYCSNVTGSLVFNNLSTVASQGMQNAFVLAGITSVSFPELTTVSGTSAFQSCFSQCTQLITASFSKLESIGTSYALSLCFASCKAIQHIYFNALKTSSFGSNTNQFNNMMMSTGTTVTHTLHFPSNLESTIAGLTGYPLFSGTSGSVVLSFDLPATE